MEGTPHFERTYWWRFRTRVLKPLSSIRLAVWILAILALVSMVGTVLNPERSGELVYRTWWFKLLLAFMCVNLVSSILVRPGTTPRRLISIAIHCSILLILAGAVVGAAFGEKGFAAIPVGHEVSEVQSRHGEGTFPLGFSLRVVDFEVELEGSEKAELLSRDPATGDVSTFAFDLNQDVNAGEGFVLEDGSRIRILRYLPDFVIGQKGPETRSDKPRNPAIQVEVAAAGVAPSTAWLFARYPNYSTTAHGGGPSTELYFNIEQGKGAVSQFRSDVEVIEDGRIVRTESIAVNSPLTHGGYTFYQSSYDQRAHAWTGLQVKSDPGIPLVYAGFAIQIIALAFFVFTAQDPHRKPVPTGTAAASAEKALGAVRESSEKQATKQQEVLL